MEKIPTRPSCGSGQSVFASWSSRLNLRSSFCSIARWRRWARRRRWTRGGGRWGGGGRGGGGGRRLEAFASIVGAAPDHLARDLYLDKVAQRIGAPVET